MNQLNTEFYARRRYWLSYNRLQLVLGGLLAVVGPWLFALVMSRRADQSVLLNSMAASVAALLIGLLTFRRFTRFPGLSSVGNLITSFTVSYLGVIAVLFFARIDYSRALLGSAFLLSLIVFSFMHIVARRNSRYLFAVVPHGTLAPIRTMSAERFHFHFLAHPEEIQGDWDGIIADFKATIPEAWERFLMASVLRGIPVYHVKFFEEQMTGRLDIEHLSENSLGSFNQHGYLEIRNIGERLIAAIALLVLAPLLAIVGLLIKLDSPGPAIFTQTRVGYRGLRFKVLKFRTMRQDPLPDSSDACRRSLAMTKTDDARITSVGRLLRKTRIDEIPQIINVLRGEMSLIGPRPEVVALSDWYEAELPFYRYRHMVRPGLTGWAQVCQGHVTDLGDIHDKLRYDFYYIKNLSFWLDLVIVLRTIRIIITGHGAR